MFVPSVSSPVRRGVKVDRAAVSTRVYMRRSDCPQTRHSESILRNVASTAAAAAVAAATAASLMFAPMSADAVANPKFPPIDRNNPNRCNVQSSKMGAANAARDSLFDLRECVLKNKDFRGYDIAGVIMEGADFSGCNFGDAILSKAFAVKGIFRDANFSNSVSDRVIFTNADLRNAIFTNAVLSESSFDNANLEGADFTNVYIGEYALRNICKNPTVKGENPYTGAPTKESLGCR